MTGMELLTGLEMGERGEDGSYPEGTVNALVDERLAELASKRAALMAQKEETELMKNDAYRRLDERFENLREELDETVAELDARDFEVTLRRLVANTY